MKTLMGGGGGSGPWKVDPFEGMTPGPGFQGCGGGEGNLTAKMPVDVVV